MNIFIRRPKKDFCEGCSFLWLYNVLENNCIICQHEEKNEDFICRNKFSLTDFKYKKYIGYYLETIDAISKKYQDRSSAWGLVTCMLEELLIRKEIDYAICVSYVPEESRFRYIKVSDPGELTKTQRSAYYPILLTDALEIILDNEWKCAITCIPSAAKALELLKHESPELRKRIKYIIWLTYHSTKLEAYTDYLCKKAGKQNGIKDCDYISYRDKSENMWKKDLGNFVAKQANREWRIEWSKMWPNWSIGLLQNFSSNFVDDHFCECADLSVMDAWHNNYRDKNGTSLAIVRNHTLLKIIKKIPDLTLNQVSPEIIIESQKQWILFKTKWLGIRLAFYKFFWNRIPNKRVQARWWKDPIKIVKSIFFLYTSIRTEYIYAKNQDWKKINRVVNHVRLTWKILSKVGSIICIKNIWVKK